MSSLDGSVYIIGPNGVFHIVTRPIFTEWCEWVWYTRLVMRPILGSSHWGGKVPLSLGPVLVVDCYLWETWDGWCTGSVAADKMSVTLPVCHQS